MDAHGGSPGEEPDDGDNAGDRLEPGPPPAGPGPRHDLTHKETNQQRHHDAEQSRPSHCEDRA